MGELVEDGDTDLLFEGRRVVAEVLEQRPPVDRDPRGQVRRLVEEPVEVRLLRVLFLDDDGDVLQPARKLRREGVERRADVLLEPARQNLGRSGARTLNRWTVTRPNAKPPTWAK